MMRRSVLAVLVVVSGCGRGGDRIVVGSKNFTESDILGEIVAQQIERRTALTVERRFHLGGTFVCHAALTAGQIDLYVEYSGTALVAILEQPVITDPDTAFARVRAAYLTRYAAEWLPPLGFNNTFAMIVRSGDTTGVRVLTQAARRTRPWRGGFGYEFMERADGFAGLQRAYGLPFAGPPRVMDLGLTYRALADSQVDMIAGNSTDGQIEALHLVALEDDLHYFPPYQAAPVVRQETLDRHPELRAPLEELAGRIDDRAMRRLNYLADVRHLDIVAVAREFLATLP
ncbi:MAG: glycine betaine ABC transporter substrate-binding protein [Gemmatimonadales bacterium]|nr:glycine betaine ABC transporter substrate-binding protein [Gemmatimonadales bacterium]